MFRKEQRVAGGEHNIMVVVEGRNGCTNVHSKKILDTLEEDG